MADLKFEAIHLKANNFPRSARLLSIECSLKPIQYHSAQLANNTQAQSFDLIQMCLRYVDESDKSFDCLRRGKQIQMLRVDSKENQRKQICAHRPVRYIESWQSSRPLSTINTLPADNQQHFSQFFSPILYFPLLASSRLLFIK